MRNLAVKGGDEALKSVVANMGVNFGVVHLNDATKFARVCSEFPQKNDAEGLSRAPAAYKS